MQNIIIIIYEPFIYGLIELGFKNLGHKNINLIIFYCYFFIFNHLMFSLLDKNSAVVASFFATFIYLFMFIINMMIFKERLNYITYHSINLIAILLFYNYVILPA